MTPLANIQPPVLMKYLPLLAASLATASAAETTVEAKPFRIEKSFYATLLPAKPVLVAIDPDGWADFTVEEILPHGAPVKKGDVLVKFDREAIDKKLEDFRRAVKARELSLASQELSFAKLEEETALKLEAARRAERIAGEELAYFTKTGRKVQEEDTLDNLESTKRRLEAAQEELKQLKMMYDADDLTEQTEEIILKRQEYAVESATLGLKHADLATKRSLEVTLPRLADTLATSAKSSAIELEKAEKNLPRGLESARLDLEAARIAAAREKQDLAELEKDALLMALKAETDGIFYHGSLDEGRWSVGELAKVLTKGGKVPFIKPFASVVPADSDLTLIGYVDEPMARSLAKDLKGSLTAVGREDIPLTTTIAQVATFPATDGKYRVDLGNGAPDGKITWPAELNLAAGMYFECRFVVHHNANAITVPVKALQPGVDGTWSVNVKTADGKGETRVVTRGRVSVDRAEILGGLEGGQVVIVPD